MSREQVFALNNCTHEVASEDGTEAEKKTTCRAMSFCKHAIIAIIADIANMRFATNTGVGR